MLQAIPAGVRDALYALGVFVNAMVAVVVTEVSLSVWVIGALAGYNAFLGILAKVNINHEDE